eukprot:m.135372 g.135372  ORF g.135372 m.135372 type:complete len:437 (+) comp14709_c0_seq1:122-1432(+)
MLPYIMYRIIIFVLLWCSGPVAKGGAHLRLLTYNCWNFDDNFNEHPWEQRKLQLSAIVLREAPDVAFFQEVRKTNTGDMMGDLKSLLKSQYAYSKWFPVTDYGGGRYEGLAVFSRQAFLNAPQLSKFPQSFADSSIINKRGMVIFTIPVVSNFYNLSATIVGTHYSTKTDEQLDNVDDMMKVIKSDQLYATRPLFLLGDLNAYHYPSSGNTSVANVVSKILASHLFLDVTPLGCTYRCGTTRQSSRDKIFMPSILQSESNNVLVHVNSVNSTIIGPSDYTVSDHLGLVADFDLSPITTTSTNYTTGTTTTITTHTTHTNSIIKTTTLAVPAPLANNSTAEALSTSTSASTRLEVTHTRTESITPTTTDKPNSILLIQPTDEPSGSRRRYGVVAFVAVLFLVLVGGTVMWFLKRSARRPMYRVFYDGATEDIQYAVS